jgi:lipoprotein-anchoring transpeptidase ErfK/SrfK
VYRPFPFVLAGLATLVAVPAAAQTYYRPEAAARVTSEPRYRHGQPRFYLPFLQRRDYGLADGEEAYPGGAVAVSPSGQRVYYIPAPRDEPQILAHTGRGDAVEEQPYQRAPRQGFDPRFRRQEVAYSGPHAPGTIVVNTSERFLYLVQPGGRAMRYGIGVGREGFSWRGEQRITRMAEWPDWRPPEEMLRRRPDLPRFMPGGPTNPLGARALYLGSTLYRIHGTNEPHTIGHAVSSGCIRMMNEDVTDLYQRVRVGTRVVVL